MKERIKQYMDYKSISAGELSTRLNVQRSNISHILNGRNKPGASFIEKFLVSYPDLNARWLFTGEGEMLNKDNTSPNSNESIKDEVPVKPASSVTRPKLSLEQALLKGINKPIEKIVLFFSDGTFTDFDANRAH